VGGIIGCDYTGVIVESADSKARTHLKPGQRVAGCVHGGKFLDKGSFAQYLKVPADLTFAVPDGLKPEEAATYGVPYFTAFHALVHSLKHGWPPAKHNGWVSWVELGVGAYGCGCGRCAATEP
jgi:NADPH:quinone reductase-like Zn-dependent oxidoreductase